MRPLRSCRKATFLLSCRRDRPLTMGENIWLKIHLGMCIHCRRFGKQIQQLSGMLQSLPEKVKPEK